MDVIKKLRIYVILSIVMIQILLLSAIFVTILTSISRSTISKEKHFLEALARNNGNSLKSNDSLLNQNFSSLEGGFDIPFTLNVGIDEYYGYCIIKISTSGSIVEVVNNFPFSFSDTDSSIIAGNIISDCREKNGSDFSNIGFISGEKKGFLYCVLNKKDGSKIITTMDRRGEIRKFHILRVFFLIVFCVSIVITFILAFFLSAVIVRPTKNAFDKQKRFVADAGHELKTPVAVIGANLDVLLPEMPDNRWLQYIKEENELMGHLVKNLLYLARKDSDRLEVQTSVFDFTTAIKNAILPFESVVFEEGKHLEIDIQEDLKFSGDEQQIKQIAVILVDNAIKNSSRDALIRVSAVSEKDSIILRVFNTGHGIKKDDLEKIFHRFYRADSSRVRKTGGYGLGLAIARTNAELNHGILTADSKEGDWAEFTLTLSLNHHKKIRFFEIFGF